MRAGVVNDFEPVTKGLGQDLAPIIEQARSVTVVNDRWRHESDRTVVVFGVVPVEQLRKRLEQAEIIIEVKKEISALLAIPLKSPDNDERS